MRCGLLIGLVLYAVTYARSDSFDTYRIQLQSKNPDERVAALYGISKLHHDGTVKVLLASLSDASEKVRIHTCFILGALKKKAAVQPLFNVVVHDKSARVAVNCAEALYNLGYESALNFIVNYLENGELSIKLLALDKLEVIGDAKIMKRVEVFALRKLDETVAGRVVRLLKLLNGELSREQLYKARTYVERADRAFLDGAISRAKQFVEKARALDPENPQIYYILGNIYSQDAVNGDLAVSAFKKAIKFGFVQQGDVLYRLGLLLIEKQKSQEAVTYLQRALPDIHTPDIRYHLAVAYANMGDNSRAIQYAEEALKLDPSYIYSHYLLSKLYEEKNKKKAAYHLQRYQALSRKK